MKTKHNRPNPYDLNALAKDLSQSVPKQSIQVRGSNPYDSNTIKIGRGQAKGK